MSISQIVTNSIADDVTIKFADGSAAAPSLTNTGDTNTGIFFPAADTIAFSEGGTEVARFNSAGNLGIGTTTANAPLSFSNSVGSIGDPNRIRMFDNGGFIYGIGISTDSQNYVVGVGGNHCFYVGNTGAASERVRIASDGNVGIGTSSPGARLHVENATTSYGQVRILNSSSSGEATINIGRTNQAIDNRWTVGQGPAGAGDTFGFYTAGSNKATLTTAGVWSTTGGGTSDLRTKKDIDYVFDNGIESVLKLKPTKFKFLSSPDKQRRGFIAQDVLKAIPDLVLGDGELENGTYGLDYDGILTLAVKAIQELKTIVDQQKTELDSVKAELATLKGAA